MLNFVSNNITWVEVKVYVWCTPFRAGWYISCIVVIEFLRQLINKLILYPLFQYNRCSGDWKVGKFVGKKKADCAYLRFPLGLKFALLIILIVAHRQRDTGVSLFRKPTRQLDFKRWQGQLVCEKLHYIYIVL